MPSPFPGMNPYLEHPSVWHDFHERFIPLAAELIGSQVLPRYFVKIDQQVPTDEESISNLHIFDRESRRLITVIELLSPSNKYAGPDREQYLRKHHGVLRSEAHLVEIDLLRGGPRMPWRRMPACDYCVVISVQQERPEAGIWPIMLRDPLPSIGIPLKPNDSPAVLNLQQMLNRIYDAAGYAYYIYANEPEPPLTADDAAWAKSLITNNE